MFLSILSDSKNFKDKNINVNSNNRITSRLMVRPTEGVDGYMILTRRVAASPVTIVLYLEHVFLVHVFHTVISKTNYLILLNSKIRSNFATQK